MSERVSFTLSPADARRFRNLISKLASLQYSEKIVKERLGAEDLSDLQWRAARIYRSDHLSSRDSLALAIDFFLLQGTLTAVEFGQLFLPDERDLLTRTGFIATGNDGRISARASLFPVGDCLLFSDHAWPLSAESECDTSPSDRVMSIGRDSRNLALSVPSCFFNSALDLCTGSGIQALMASRHSARVLAVDINPRAARCTRFNAEISGSNNVDVVVGDLFEPINGERFDLITANPPFVPSPLDNLRFRDGGPSGEDVQKRIIAGLPAHLAPGGFAQIVTELGERDNESIIPRLRRWLNHAPMDIYILRLGEHTSLRYAIAHAQGNDYQAFLDSAYQWSSNLRAQGYLRMVSMVISFKWSDRRCGPPWTRMDQSPPPRRPAGDEIEAAFLAEYRARRSDWQQVIQHSCLRLSGPIALLNAHVLGCDLRAKPIATLLGQALTVEHQLDSIECQVLAQVEEQRSVPALDLLTYFKNRKLDSSDVLAATRSLLRRKLLCLDVNCAPPHLLRENGGNPSSASPA
jgi:hypothetical protein